jgi:hypothetical protein
MKLTAENVNQTLLKCLYNDGENTENHIKAHGVRLNIGFDPVRLDAQKDNIISMVNELPEDFKIGMSFLNACMTKHGAQWGEHSNIDELLCLGQAVGAIEMLVPREGWSMLPGGMPYFKISNPEVITH